MDPSPSSGADGKVSQSADLWARRDASCVGCVVSTDQAGFEKNRDLSVFEDQEMTAAPGGGRTFKRLLKKLWSRNLRKEVSEK